MTDEVIVMRDGRFVTRAPTAEVTRQQMANLMVGRELADLYPPRDVGRRRRRRPPCGAQLQRARLGAGRELRGAPRRDPRLRGPRRRGPHRTLRRPAGPASRERQRSRCSASPCRSKGWRNPRDAAKHGLTYLSEDRKGKGLHVNLGLRQNLTLMALERYAQPWLKPEAERGALAEAVKDYGIRTGSLDVKRIVAVGRQPAEARARQGASAAAQGGGARRAHARRRRGRQARHLFPDPATRPRRARGDRRLVGADGADRPVPPRRGDARGPSRCHARRGPSD